jgi:hypothetical protein
MKKIIIAFFTMLMLGWCHFIYPDQGKLFFKLPVRVISEKEPVSEYAKDLNKNDFELSIDGEQKPVLEFFKKERSIAGTAGERQFVLAFDAVDYGKPLADAVSHFVQQILTPSDQLLIRSPIQTYRIDTKSDKQEAIQYIKTILEKDIKQWKENKAAFLNNLNQSIENLEKKLDARKGGLRSVLFFINHYANEWRKFDKGFLLANLEQYADITSLLAQKSGEKWWIHFQERDLVPMLTRYRKIVPRIKKYLSSLPKEYQDKVSLIQGTMDKIERSMLFTEDFPMDDIMDILLGVNINYNVIFFSTQDQEADSENSVSPGYEKILKDISRAAGGISIISAPGNLVTPLETVGKHVDFYYELVFALPGEPGDKHIKINVTTGSSAYYKKKFRKEELAWLMDWVKEEIGISGFALAGRQLSFTVSGFKMDSIKNADGQSVPTGIIKVGIRLIDEKSITVYETGNTMKSNDKSFKVSLGLPSKFSGYFKLSITAVDLVANQDCELNKYVKIQ